MRKISQFAILPIFISCFLGTAQAADPVGHPQVATTRSTANLKPYMSKFGSMLASLEIIQLKEKKPDWEAIDIALKEMSQTLADMQKADKDKAYQEYTDVLAAGMVELNEKSAKRDKSFFRSLDKISEGCFKCHAAHRPGDYLIPKNDKDLLTKDAPSDGTK
ncbi:MAG: hypothetical protein K8R69_06915 [Deltaproteobacteria bacterium]|nr:hypothetical protein [Deltaproteobacteria bacterium]